jgi:co-chaperonin GroES (HSP10)
MPIKLPDNRVLLEVIPAVNPTGIIIINPKPTNKALTCRLIKGSTQDVRPQDVVVISTYSGNPIFINDKEFLIVHKEELLAKIIED